MAFRLDANEWHGHSIETVWCIDLGNGLFKLDNVPFYARDVAVGDVVRAASADGGLVAVEVVRRGGHSTYRIITLDPTLGQEQFLERWRPLDALGCSFEGNGSGLFAIDVPACVNLERLRQLLDVGVDDGVWDYEEACLVGRK